MGLSAFFPNLFDLVVVVAQINGRVDNHETKNHECRDSNLPHGRPSLQNLILERYTFRVVLLEPFFCGVDVGEDLDVVGIAYRLAVLT